MEETHGDDKLMAPKKGSKLGRPGKKKFKYRTREELDAAAKAKSERAEARTAKREAKDTELRAKINPADPIWKQLAIERCRKDPAWFLEKFVYTYDQMDDEDVVKLFPMHRAYFKILLDTILRDKITIIPKSRQMTTSWFLCALMLWKTLFHEQSEGYVQCQNEDDVDYFVQNRIQAIYKRLPDWMKPPSTAFSYTKCRLKDNGSFISGLPSGEHKSRGRAPSILVSDELAFQESGDGFGNTLPAIGGSGLAVGVSTPYMKNHFHRMCFPKPKDMKHIETIVPFPDWPKTRIERYEKHTVIFLHYTADPDKRSQEWFEAEQAKFFAQGKSAEAWAQEYELDFEKTGKPKLFPSYDPAIHEVEVKYDPFLPIIRGWDFGNSYPACSFMQRLKNGQIVLLDALLLEDCNLDIFAEQVLDYCEENFPPGVHKGVKYLIEYKDYCDHSGTHTRDTGNNVKILRRRWDVRLKSQPSKPEERTKLIRTHLRINEKGIPGFVVNKHCFLVTEGFRGAFTSETNPAGHPTGKPFKDGIYDNVLDSIGYPMDCLFNVPKNQKIVLNRKKLARRRRAKLHQRYLKSVTGYSYA